MGDAADDLYWAATRGDDLGGDSYINIDNVVFKHATDKAVLVAYEGEEHWVPRSVLSWKCDRLVDTLHRLDTFELSVREWYANQEGWI